jgi:hypothetical protein
MFAAAGVVAALAIAAPALAGQASRRATNKDQKAQTSEPDRRTSSREEARPPAPAARSSQASKAPAHYDGPPDPPTPRRAVPRPANNPPPRETLPRERDSRPVYVPARPVVVAPRHVVIAPRYPTWGRYDRRWWGAPRHIVRYHQPYYVFRPHVRFSFGLTIGHPVAYPVWYDPRPYYGYSIGPRYGGISFDMDPYDAAIFIDGEYVGIVDDFSPYDAPLTLRAGRHRVEIRSRGYQPMSFDITVVPGQVIPYRGALGYLR